MSVKPIIVGKVSGVYGVKGWVKVFSWTQPKENIVSYNPLWLEQADRSWKSVSVTGARPQGRTVVLKLEGVNDRDAAALLNGTRLAIQPEQLPKLEDAWYWSELIGLTVVTEDGQTLGQVSEMQATGANDVMIIGRGENAVLVPFVNGPIVKQVDVDAGRILVDWNPEYL